MKHTKECEDAQEAYKKSLAAYEKAADAAQAAWDKAHTKCKEVKE